MGDFSTRKPLIGLLRRMMVLVLFGIAFFFLFGENEIKLGAVSELRNEDLTRLIKEKNLKKHLFEIAGDSYEGRGAGYSGEMKTAKYIAEEFRKYQLTPVGDKIEGRSSYFQKFTFHPRKPEKPFETLTSRNVVAFYEGSDETLRNEIVVIGCHYDGQGMAGQADAGRRPADDADSTDKIWNSADDNATSVGVLLEVARVISQNKLRPKRSVLFIAFGAEEHALNGSAYYVEHPVFERDRHVAMLNIEKLGRIPERMPITASGGTSPIWDKVIASANKKTGMKVESILPELISDTDHYPFAMLKIPAMVIGMAHEEDTHLPSDSPEKISFDKLAQRTGFVLTAFLELANTHEEMPFTGDLSYEPGFIAVATSDVEMKAIGLAADRAGYKVSMIIPNSPAEKSGMNYGDLIVSKNGVEFDRKEIDDERVFFKDEKKREGFWVIKIIRNGKKKTLKLQFRN